MTKNKNFRAALEIYSDTKLLALVSVLGKDAAKAPGVSKLVKEALESR
jgi:hypothetical protein